MQDHAAYRQKGITASPQTQHPLRDTTDWQAAKDNAGGRGIVNARHIIDQLWRPELSAEVAERVKGMKNIRFVTVPSTSGRNQLPIALAERLQKDLGRGEILIGETIAYSDDMQPMKDVLLRERPFMPRRYILFADNELSSKDHVVIVEDIMSSGASAKAFADCLLANNIPVVTTVCLLGKPKLFAEPALVRDLQRSFKEHNINLDAKLVGNVLAKNQIILLLEHIKRRKDAIPSIAERISRVLDARASGHVGGHSQREAASRRLLSGTGQSDARTGDGVRNQPHRPDNAGNGKTSSSEPQAQAPVGKRKRRRLLSWLILAISG